MEMKFKVGDIVRFSDDDNKHKGVGEIITIDPVGNAPYGIFSKDIVKGHDFGGCRLANAVALNKGSDRNCWWFDEWELELAEEPIEETKVEEKSRNELDKEVWERILFKNHLITIVKRDDCCDYEYADVLDTKGHFIDKIGKESTEEILRTLNKSNTLNNEYVVEVLSGYVIFHKVYTKEELKEFCRCFSLTYDEIMDNCYINVVGNYVIVMPD